MKSCFRPQVTGLLIVSFIGLLVVSGSIAFSGEATAPASPTGRRFFWDNEPMPLALPAEGNRATVTLETEGVDRVRLKVPVIGDVAFFTLKPFALTPGEWTAKIDDATFDFTVVSSIERTPFTIAVYQGNVWANGPSHNSGVGPEKRRELYRDVYGINMLMLQRVPGVYRLSPELMDAVIESEARFTSVFSIAGTHQPGGGHNDWSHPEVVESIQYRAAQMAQYFRPYGGFLGVHYADEPGLTWGRADDEGNLYAIDRLEDEETDYLGPLAVPIQHEMYKKITGRPAPDWRNPFDNLEQWLDFTRWRTTIMGDAFRELQRTIHRVDPDQIAYSQVYEWAAISDGCYPPEQGHGVDVLSTHAYTDRQLGMWYPAHETDAMRTGAWDKPLWMLPTWAMDLMPEDGVRACVYSTLARKVEGLTWPLDWFLTWPQAEEVSQRILPISAALAKTQKVRDRVGIFSSRDQHLVYFAEEVDDGRRPGRSYAGRLNDVWLSAMALHMPASYVTEEDLFSGAADEHRVLITAGLTYARPKTVDALEEFIADGGAVIIDADSTVEIDGAHQLSFSFVDWFSRSRRGHELYQDYSDRRRFDEYVRPHLPELREALKPHVQPVAECDNPMFMVTEQGADAGRYIWAVNMAQQDRMEETGERWHLVDSSANLTLPPGDYVAYDVFNQHRLDDRDLELDLAKGDAALFALLPRAVEGVDLAATRWDDKPALQLSLEVHGAEGEAIDAVIPLQVRIIQPDGSVFRDLSRATRHGRFSEDLPVGSITMPGTWTIEVTELLSGRSASAEVLVRRDIRRIASSAEAEVIDPDRIAGAFRPDPSRPGGEEILVLYGDDDHRAAAEELADVLAQEGLDATADEAGEYLIERPSTRHTVRLNPRSAGYPLDINKQTVILGNPETNPLIDRLTNQYRISPRPLGPLAPGEGRALVFWAHGLFGLYNDIVVILADDSEGLAHGASAVKALARGKEPATFPVEMAE